MVVVILELGLVQIWLYSYFSFYKNKKHFKFIRSLYFIHQVPLQIKDWDHLEEWFLKTKQKYYIDQK